MLRVIDARQARGYRLRLKFSDDVEGEANLESILGGPIFEPLREPEKFAQFSISPVTGTLEWENGADIAPEALEDLITESMA